MRSEENEAIGHGSLVRFALMLASVVIFQSLVCPVGHALEDGSALIILSSSDFVASTRVAEFVNDNGGRIRAASRFVVLRGS